MPRLEECEGLGGPLPGFPPLSWAGKASSELDFEKGRSEWEERRGYEGKLGKGAEGWPEGMVAFTGLA